MRDFHYPLQIWTETLLSVMGVVEMVSFSSLVVVDFVDGHLRGFGQNQKLYRWLGESQATPGYVCVYQVPPS